MKKVTQWFFLCSALWLLSTSVLAATIARVEPPSWWVGMQDSSLQLLVHGEGIGAATVTTDAANIRIAEVHAADSPNYLFVDLVIGDAAKAADMPLVFTLPTGEQSTYPYPLLEREPGSADRKGFSQKDVIYLITPDRFANADLDNDEVDGLTEGINREAVGGRHGGDIAGVMAHLDYIAAMGFTQLWVNPVLENNMPSYSYHGYAATDFYQIDARYGSNALYRQLSHKAHDKGLGLIMDVVLNHAGSEHWWMHDKPFHDWINFGGKFTATTHRRETLHDPNASAHDVRQFVDGWFVPTMPDLNQRNPFMANYLIQNSLWWIEYADLSGLRVDTYSYPDKDFLTEWTRRVMHEYPSLNIVGEEWTENPAILSYWQHGKQTHDGYVSYLPGLFDFPLQKAVTDALLQEETWGTGMITLYNALANDFLYPEPENLVIFPDNHDMSRIYTQLEENTELWQMAMVIYATMRGIPQIYYGTEILMSNPGTDDHGVIRTDFPGGWPDDKVNAFTGKGLSAEQKMAQEFLRGLLSWRKTSEAVHRGKLMHFVPVEGVYVYFRYVDNDQKTNAKSVMVVINHTDKAQALNLDIYAERLNGKRTALDVLGSKKYSLQKGLSVKAMSASIFELE